MRVKCISDNWKPSHSAAVLPSPAIGDIDIVIKEERFFGEIYYDLERFPETLFHCEMFATLPDTTADEMQEEEKAIVNLETA
jgi:hypothetical protein